MPKSPFTLAFDHIDDCPQCDLFGRHLCPTGHALFKAAHDMCKLLASDEIPESKSQA